MKSRKIMFVGMAIVFAITLIAVFADLIAPFDPRAIGIPFQRPNDVHILGTNDIGNDIFSELVYGARYSLLTGFVAMCIASVIGVLIGTVSGMFGGNVDSVLMKLTSFVYTIPYLPLLIVLSVFMRGSLITTALIIGLISWPEMARVLRAQTIKIMNSEYVSVIKIMGAGKVYLFRKHVFRELLPLIAHRAVYRFRTAIIAESSLSFLGLAASTVKSWGTMLFFAQARNAFLTDAWLWWVIPPGLLIFALSLGLTLIAYSLESKIDPRLEG
jgi:ABC-type dipeptide/oligopeptide/nickel transport system permease subunit